MEIVDYLRVARRRLWLLVGVPVAAGGVAASLVLLAPEQYTATSHVAAPALVGGTAAQQYTGNQAANQFAAAFAAAVTAPQVVDQVAAETGVSAQNLRTGLAVTQVGASSQLEVSYTTTKRQTVAPVLTATARHALTFLFASQASIAEAEVKAATEELDTATAGIRDWEKANKVSQPDKLYQATLNEIASLRQQQLQMQAVGNSRAAAAAGDAITAAQKRLDTLGPKLPDYQALIAQREAAAAALANARQDLQAARAQVQAANPEQVTSLGEVKAVPRTRALVNLVLPVTGAGLLLAVLLVAVLELLRRDRGARGRAAVPAVSVPAVAAPRSARPNDDTVVLPAITAESSGSRGHVSRPAAEIDRKIGRR